MEAFSRLYGRFRRLMHLHTVHRRQQGLCAAAKVRLSVQQAADVWARRFEEAGVSEPGPSSQYIVAHVLGVKTMANLEPGILGRTLTDVQMQQVWELCGRRLCRMPVQYVIEEWDFRDITLKMRPPVFIPRPETEDLVSFVLADLQPAWGAGFTVLEVGCGSGAISLSLLQNLPRLRVIALDRNKAAVDLTNENAHRLGLRDRLQVLHLDVMQDAEKVLRECGLVDVLVSNPPYLFSQDVTSLQPEILEFEDLAALDGGADGLQIIRQILSLAPHLLKDQGRVYLEVDPRHPPLIEQYVEEAKEVGLQYIQTQCDITERPRFSILQKTRPER
ncbi:MTRF1L release factor glutamine methyltransferase isoform X2 [Brienomyrus brachyistius]|uniref:MTRF1L release factor glutamine methyltransferase isoform X2 n=2 Tax=Brienomyrus brachyistius TaxID=42636 RepID=UPI0020B211D7|nr:MTRF1L release factor glutamine methyltransferase isoform X2 [Brienomyrus brachyistius]